MNRALIKKPVVVVVGHIDHGKTSLLDYIRKSRVAERESGGITQKISAYEITHTAEGEERGITFIDTPGHEAFQKMRAQGARSADIAILVIAADDGVKPQTLEAWKAITEANIPFVVAFTKKDKDGAHLERAKESALKEGIYLEGLGGTIPSVAVSSKTGEGVSELLDTIILLADLNDVSCDSDGPASATVIESSRDHRSGVSATVIVRYGTFSVGNFAVTAGAFAPLRTIEDASGKKVKEVRCGSPARIVGFSTEPAVGSVIEQVRTKKEAEKMSEAISPKKETVPLPEKDAFTLRLFLKADTVGSLEALEYEIKKVSHDQVALVTIGTGVGPVTEGDVKNLIGFEQVIILGFNVSIEDSALDLAHRHALTIHTDPIIYKITEWLQETVTTRAPEEKEVGVVGTAKVIKHFSSTGAKHVVGARVESGTLKRGAICVIERRGVEVGKGKILNIQSQKKDVDSLSEGECGMQVESKADVVSGDILLIKNEYGGKRN